MSRTSVILILLVVLGAAGAYRYVHRDDNRLRLDDVHWRCPSVGELQEGGNLEESKDLAVSFSLRGCTPTSDSMCKVQFRSEVSGPPQTVPVKVQVRGPRGKELIPLDQLGPIPFRKNSPTTSMNFGAVLSGFQPGAYQLSIIAEDLNSKAKVQTKIGITVGDASNVAWTHYKSEDGSFELDVPGRPEVSSDKEKLSVLAEVSPGHRMGLIRYSQSIAPGEKTADAIVSFLEAKEVEKESVSARMSGKMADDPSGFSRYMFSRSVGMGDKTHRYDHWVSLTPKHLYVLIDDDQTGSEARSGDQVRLMNSLRILGEKAR